MRALRRIPAGPVPQVVPVADLARFEVRFCDLNWDVSVARDGFKGDASWNKPET